MRGRYIYGGKAEKHKKVSENWKMGKNSAENRKEQEKKLQKDGKTLNFPRKSGNGPPITATPPCTECSGYANEISFTYVK